MKATFKKEDNLLVIVADSEDVCLKLNSIITAFFLDMDVDNNKYKIEATLEYLELFHDALVSQGVEVLLTEKMGSALNKVKEKSQAIEEEKTADNVEAIIKVEKRTRPSTLNRKKDQTDQSELAGEKSITLSKLFSKIKQAIEINIPNEIWLEAEIANMNKSPKGHYYLDLIETDFNGNEIAKNKAIIWSSNASTIERKFKDGTGSSLDSGQKVLLKVKVTFDVKFGLNLAVVNINPTFTLGDMEAKIIKIVNQLKEEGLYEKNKRVKTPYIYKHLAVIAPEEAAGLKDFQIDAEKLDRKNICKFDYYQAFFQGRDASSSIVKAFENIEKSGIDYDGVIVIRGGGAKTDLHYLNDYEIAKKICNSNLPVIVGIGHQIDHGILDEVACFQYDTPSKVIGYIYSSLQEKYSLLIESRERLLRNLENMVQNTKRNIENININNKSKLENSLTVYKNEIKMKKLYVQQGLSKLVDTVRSDLLLKRSNLPNEMFGIIEVSKRNMMEKHRNVLGSLDNMINITRRDIDKKYFYVSQFNPKELFKKGFSVALDKNESPIKSVNDVKNGDSIKLYLNDGFINTTVEK